MALNLKARIAAEKTIARRVVKDALAAGYTLSVDNGGDTPEIENSSSFKLVVAEMFATDEERLYFYKDSKPAGMVQFVYGNDGYDVMADYSVSLEDVLKGAKEVANKIEARA